MRFNSETFFTLSLSKQFNYFQSNLKSNGYFLFVYSTEFTKLVYSFCVYIFNIFFLTCTFVRTLLLGFIDSIKNKQ